LNDRIVEPLKGAAVREIVRLRARMANEPPGKLSARALRSGFVTEAGKQGISLGETGDDRASQRADSDGLLPERGALDVSGSALIDSSSNAREIAPERRS